ncbi:hypothetical protein [Rhodococcus qingshengii]|uniref:hypothetical protein n=1 Tax=Rhodococcus qingshengii TaxID=334542 RepID=UPI001C5E0A55|nr:hypothetical protein [Rhodococcus qingshengii]MBW4818719.1 hypothetical protein [Rhodococcus qingshengii]
MNAAEYFVLHATTDLDESVSNCLVPPPGPPPPTSLDVFGNYVRDTWFYPITIPSTAIRFSYWRLLVVGVGFGLLLHWSHEREWGANQWGSVAAWFGGVLTFTAVSVSLYQTKLARDDADEARRKAAEQIAREQALHSANLAAADNRLILQLDTQSRHNQAILVAQIWKSSSKFNKICEDLLQALFDANGINTPVHAKRQRVETLKAAMINAERDLDNSLSDANLLVTDSETRKLLEDIQKHADQLLSKVSAIHQSIVKVHGIEQGEYDSASKHQKMLHNKLNKLMNTARRNITGVPSLKPEDDEIQS